MRWERDMTETRIGTVTHYYNHLHVAGVTITGGELHKGDTIHVKGHTSDFEQKVESMEIDHEALEVAKPGNQIGLTVIEHAREHDTFSKIHSERLVSTRKQPVRCYSLGDCL